MAKTSAIQKNLKRIKLVKKYASKRAALKKIIKNKKNISKFLLEEKKKIEKIFNIKIEYLELRNEKSLLISNKTFKSKIFASYYFKGIRLIDNF